MSTTHSTHPSDAGSAAKPKSGAIGQLGSKSNSSHASSFSTYSASRSSSPLRSLETLVQVGGLGYSAREYLMRGLGMGFGLGIGAALLFISADSALALQAGIVVFALFEAAFFALIFMAARRRVARIEASLPDFLGFMASNIRSGMTYDRALLFSARKEFGPLAQEVDLAAKEALSGTPLSDALVRMSSRIGSETVSRTVRLIVEGFNSGGNLADLLETTSLDLRRFETARKEVAASVLSYKLFLLVAAGLGAPLLYGVGHFLIEIMYNARQKIGSQFVPEAAQALPFFNPSAGLAPDSVFWFSIIALLFTAVFSSFAAGVISKGRESEGLSYIPLLAVVSLVVFYAASSGLDVVLAGLFGM